MFAAEQYFKNDHFTTAKPGVCGISDLKVIYLIDVVDVIGVVASDCLKFHHFVKTMAKRGLANAQPPLVNKVIHNFCGFNLHVQMLTDSVVKST